MSGHTSIEWTDCTWNPTRGCTRVSEGCRHCYAEQIAARFSGPGLHSEGFAKRVDGEARWTGRVELIESKIDEPLRWQRPRRVFVNSMSDLFHESLSDEAIAAVFGVMAAAPLHTFQVLTKRPERMRQWFDWLAARGGLGPYVRSEEGRPALRDFFASGTRTELYRGQRVRSGADAWAMVMNGAACVGRGPLRNVWLGVSVEDQATADARIPLLLQTPAAVRFASYEPALGPVDFTRIAPEECRTGFGLRERSLNALSGWCHFRLAGSDDPKESRSGSGRLDWIIVGGESGPEARPFDIAWTRETIEQCRHAGVACFVKQLGARPFAAEPDSYCILGPAEDGLYRPRRDRDRKGGDWSEWPADLRVREFPARSPRDAGGCEAAAGEPSNRRPTLPTVALADPHAALGLAPDAGYLDGPRPAAQAIANYERDRTADLEQRLADAQRALVTADDLTVDWRNSGLSEEGLDIDQLERQVALARAAMAEKGEGK